MLSLGTIASKIFGSSNDRRVRGYRSKVEAINALEPEIEKLSDAELRARTDKFRKQLEDGADLEDLLVPAFATVREAAKRTLKQRHFDVQLIGGMVLHQGKISEMKTGEGKTLVATLPVYLNSLAQRGVHVVTVNDYLARRDSEWMGQVYRFLGLTVGCIVHELDDDQRRQQYACDVTYGTNNEFGFDYLRDNMKMRSSDMVQRGHCFAIVDEVDSILIDEARTPLIISGPVEDRSDLYIGVDKLIPSLEKGDFEIDEKQRQVSLTESGNEHIEKLLQDAELLKSGSLYDIENVSIVHHVNQALKAHKLFHRDRDYIVKNEQVVIIDEFTGRMMQGRRYSEGLHQALEAKERVEIQPENQTLASITFQNYFRLYEKLAGMTGTAATEASEFMDIYGLDVLEIPTNVPVARADLDDEVYRTAKEKWNAIIADIERAQKRKQPMLVGTVSIEKSEMLSDMLKARGIPHQVLNARYHEQEAYIIAQAGVPGAVTIATNMAGRGTDIQLGGNLQMRTLQECADLPEGPERDKKIAVIEEEIERNRQIVLNAEETIELEPAKNGKGGSTHTLPGGLYVIGTERHESRRIDNQLRGRSGRQGDPGRTKFYLSLEDDLMRIFAADRIDGMLQKFGLEEGEAITHRWINKALENAQKKVEARNFDARKYVLKYDDVMNDQRKVIFEQRVDIMGDEDVTDTVEGMRHQVLHELVSSHIPQNAYAEQWNVAGLKAQVQELFGLDLPVEKWAAEEGIADQEIRERLIAEVDAKANAVMEQAGTEILKGYDNAKSLLAFVDSEPDLKALLEREPSDEGLTMVGRAILASNRSEIRINGAGSAEAAEQAEQIGFAFWRQYMEARSLAQAIESTDSRSPAEIGKLRLREVEKTVLLQTLDGLWREHLVTLEHLRQVVGFRSYGQRDPLNEYKSESFTLFESMLGNLREEVTGRLMHLPFSAEEPPPDIQPVELPAMQAHHINPATGEDEFEMAEAIVAGGRAGNGSARQPRAEPMRVRKASAAVNPNDPATWGKVARNDKCPCGSGKKYKHCHGRH